MQFYSPLNALRDIYHGSAVKNALAFHAFSGQKPTRKRCHWQSRSEKHTHATAAAAAAATCERTFGALNRARKGRSVRTLSYATILSRAAIKTFFVHACTRGTSRALADSTRALSFFAALSRAVPRGGSRVAAAKILASWRRILSFQF